MSELSYGFSKTLEHTTFDDAVSLVTDALKSEGFGILSEIDVKKAFREKLGVEFRRYLILGACNPKLAHEALKAEAHLGLLLPCNVVVQEAVGGGVVVSIVDPETMFTLVDNQDLQPIAEEADARLRRVIEQLG